MLLIKKDILAILFNIFITKLIVKNNNKEVLKRLSIIILGSYILYKTQKTNIETIGLKEGK